MKVLIKREALEKALGFTARAMCGGVNGKAYKIHPFPESIEIEVEGWHPSKDVSCSTCRDTHTTYYQHSLPDTPPLPKEGCEVCFKGYNHTDPKTCGMYQTSKMFADEVDRLTCRAIDEESREAITLTPPKIEEVNCPHLDVFKLESDCTACKALNELIRRENSRNARHTS